MSVAGFQDEASTGDIEELNMVVVNPHKSTKKRNNEVAEVKKIAANETRYLCCTKFVVWVILIAMAALVSAGTYRFLLSEEDDDYAISYDHFSNTVRDAAQFHIRNIMLTTRGLSTTITAEAEAQGATVPYVTIPTYESLAGAARTLTGLEVIFLFPRIQEDMLDAWGNYSAANANSWLETSRATVLASPTKNLEPSDYVSFPVYPRVFFPPFRGNPLTEAPFYGPGPFFPVWMQSPPPFTPAIVNVDAGKGPLSMPAAVKAREGVISSVSNLSFLIGTAVKKQDHEDFHESLVGFTNPNLTSFDHPHSVLFTPVFKQAKNDTSEVWALLGSIIAWDRYLVDLLPEGVGGLYCILRNSCGVAHTYILEGNSARYIGEGDFHDHRYNDTEVVIPFYDFVRPEETKAIEGHCYYTFHVYSSEEFEDRYRSNVGLILTIVVASTFAVLILTFTAYDCLVKRRNEKVVNVAARTNAIVSSLFPSNVRDRLLNRSEEDADDFESIKHEDSFQDKMESASAAYGPFSNRNKLRGFLQPASGDDSTTRHSGVEGEVHVYKTKPIADIFPETTILFADIVGFTAWSSTREPSQVFTLLETIYKAFDDIANRRMVFKVETVGDCYVAVCGLPDPRADHAVVMARFARAVLCRMLELVHRLEVLLGPDTADLSLRIGLHSGPVTAGVLRGERARFQLFGDTMNTASRMESTGESGKIQLSQETADLLTAAGKGNWLRPREDKIVAKGKGTLQTYWLSSAAYSESVVSSLDIPLSVEEDMEADDLEEPEEFVPRIAISDKVERLVKWNGELLLRLLQEMECTRDPRRRAAEAQYALARKQRSGGRGSMREGTVLDEFQEIIHLPKYVARKTRNIEDVDLGPAVEEQLLSFIRSVAMMYKDNPFHCFEHASHVTMSVSKLLSRIVAPELPPEQATTNMASALHDHTYGITSDPLTQFACVFSALIHDVDHSGVPNVQLAVENPAMARMYGNRSIAEQNSVDVAWNLLMVPEYHDLRNAIYTSPEEEGRFRQLVVNSVMATDILDLDLKKLRNARWDRAFARSGVGIEESPKDAIDRKATIVIEHLIQASDVVHTMQHWHIYRKWNQRLFCELLEAHVNGRAATNPAEFWFEGELKFFDFYIIPLARKLKDCGVFGVSSDEYLNYALKNREEWENRGREIVIEMLEEVASASASSLKYHHQDSGKVMKQQDDEQSAAQEPTT